MLGQRGDVSGSVHEPVDAVSAACTGRLRDDEHAATRLRLVRHERAPLLERGKDEDVALAHQLGGVRHEPVELDARVREKRLEDALVVRLHRAADDEPAVLGRAGVEPGSKRVVEALPRLAASDEDGGERPGRVGGRPVDEERPLVVPEAVQHELLLGDAAVDEGLQRVLGRDEQCVGDLVLLLLALECLRVERVRVAGGGLEAERGPLARHHLVGMRGVRVRNLTEARDAEPSRLRARLQRRTRPAVHDVHVVQPPERTRDACVVVAVAPVDAEDAMRDPASRDRKRLHDADVRRELAMEARAVERDPVDVRRNLPDLVVGGRPDARATDAVRKAVEHVHRDPPQRTVCRRFV